MDALTRLLDGPRGRGAYLVRALMEPPWGVSIEDRAPVGMVAVLRGGAWVEADTGESAWLAPGDVAIMRGPETFTCADGPGTTPGVVLHPEQRCTSPGGKDLTAELTLGPRLWGNDLGGSTELVLGCYLLRGAVSSRLLSALPRVARLPHGGLDQPLLPLLSTELRRDGPGQDAVLDRLFDLLFVSVLRAWSSGLDGPQPAWYRGQDDPVVGQALDLLHEHPDRPWTIADLAVRVGTSRATLARRFNEVVGEPPMSYLTGWRLALAADRMLDPDATLESVARAVGYGSGFALSAAFKRERGMSPREHREHELGGDDVG